MTPETRISLECIFTYREREQEIYDITIPIPSKKYDVLKPFFSILDESSIIDLVKISTCMIAPKGIDLPKCLEECNGKFYFNIDVNDDGDTRENCNFKNHYLDGNVGKCGSCGEKNVVVLKCEALLNDFSVCGKRVCDGCSNPEGKGKDIITCCECNPTN